MDWRIAALIIFGYVLFGSLFAFGVERAAKARFCKNCGHCSDWTADFNFFWFKYLFKRTLKNTITCKECGTKEKVTILKKENRIIS